MLTTRITLLTVLLALTSCRVGSSEESDSDSPAAQQVLLCEQMCAKPLCSGVLEPGPDFEKTCSDQCELSVSLAAENACFDRYQIFLECLDGLSCEQTQEWFDQTPGHPCGSEEEVVINECEVEVRW